MCRPFLWNEILSGVGSSENCPISLPSNVNAPVLSSILDYCRFHQVPGRSNKEKKSFNEKFLSIDGKSLCELVGAADRLQLSNLVSLTSHAIAREINRRNAFEIQELLMSFLFRGEEYMFFHVSFLIMTCLIDLGRKIGTYQRHNG